MERFSPWRDSATGLAPFVYPVPPAGDSQLLFILSIWWPLGAVLALARSAIFWILLAANALLLEVASSLMQCAPGVGTRLGRLVSSLTGRLALFTLGYWRIQVHTIPGATSYSHKSGVAEIDPIKRGPQAGDLVVSNLSSPADMLYLAFRHNPVFLRPAVHSQGTLRFQVVSLLSLVAWCGHPPVEGINKPMKLSETLHLGKQRGRPVVLFPECTSSNNRALLKLCRLSPNDVSTCAKTSRVFFYFFRHDGPSPLLPSATLPIPSSLWNSVALARFMATPLPRGMRVRTHSPSECGQLTAESCETWGNRLASLGKVKKVIAIGWENKRSFIEHADKRRT